MTDLRAALAAFDGTHVAPLKALVGAPSEALLAELPGPHEIAASWVLKAQAEAGDVCAEVFAKLPDLRAPDAILHVLQMVQYAPETRLPDLTPYLAHPKLLVRVWALDALARTDPDAASPLIEAALTDRSAAMRARAKALRNL